jgi:WXG100 family type VII secretion target
MSDILVTPPQLRDNASQIRNRARTIQACIDAVDRQIKALGPGRFEGASADYIRNRYNRMRQKFYSFKPLLESFARELEDAAVRFEQADKALK